jgi:hypothetical protein
MEKFGIENLKILINFIAAFSLKLIDDLNDKKLSLIECLGLLKELVVVPSLVKKRAEIVQEITDLSASEFLELAYYVKAQLPEHANKANEITQKSLDILKGIVELINVLHKGDEINT